MSNTQDNGLPEEALLQQAASGELEALVKLDSMGFIMGPKETPETFAARIRTLKANIAKMDKSLADTGKYEVEGVAVSAKDRISRKLFDEAAELDRSLYGFSIDWVPGFFIDPFFLFGGCAFAFYPEFFAMFIIRRSFHKQSKWFITFCLTFLNRI